MTQLQTTLRQFRLSGLAQTLDVRLQEAAAGRLGHGEFLELLFQDELNVRHQRHLGLLVGRLNRAVEKLAAILVVRCQMLLGTGDNDAGVGVVGFELVHVACYEGQVQREPRRFWNRASRP